ncbi:MAG: ATP-binding protein [Sphaerochaetaceae bacterium]
MIDRPLYIDQLMRYKDKDLIKVITGVRRCGKSVLLFNLYKDWLIKSGIKDERIITVNLEDKDNAGLRNSDALYSYIKGRITDSGKYYVMIDEIQYVIEFEDLLNSLRNRGLDVYITGSNSRMLSGDISTVLRGRSIEIRVHTLSFSEYYSYVGGNKDSAFRDYMLYGGFPYAATESDKKLKIQYLTMLQDTVATKDVIERYGIRNAAAFNATYDFLCSNIGSTVSAKKIADTLKSNGYKTLTPDTIGNYLQWMSESFLFNKVSRYDVRGREYLKTQNKYYATDLGLRNARLNYRQIEPTHALENIIYNELLRRGYNVHIGKNKDKEIDFIASNPDDTFYIQVAYSIDDPGKRAQETRPFDGIDDGYRKYVINMDNDPFNLMERGYRKLNAIDFLMNSDSLI